MTRKIRLGAMALAMPACAPARAGCLPVVTGDDSVAYVDSATLSRHGAVARAWLPVETRRPASSGPLKGVRSVRYLLEFDCRGGLERILAETRHSGPMATGQVSFIGNFSVDDPWIRIASGSVRESVGKRACDLP
jgi:hypothetical protein